MNQIPFQDFKAAFQNRRPSVIGIQNEYAVLTPLVDVAGELHLLYEVRSDHLQRQPGEVCFPGGKMEPCESAEACAIRETSEELSIDPSDIAILGPMDYMHHQGVFVMYPFLGIIPYEAVQKMTPNPSEVKETFLAPLRFFWEQKPVLYQYDMVPDVGSDFPYDMIQCKNGYSWQKGKAEVPIYHYGKHVIWGITGRITRSLVQTMQKYQAYKDKK